MIVPTERITTESCFRIIPSKFRPENLFQRVTDSEDLENIIELEDMTNDRLRDEKGEIKLVEENRRVTGPGASYLMAPFTHLNPSGSRFTDGSYGVYYAAMDLDTAVSETIFHREKFLRSTNEPPMNLEMRVLIASLDGILHDIRKLKDDMPDIYDKESYSASQAFGVNLYKEGSNGIIYMSVRNENGECVAIFYPPLLSNCHQGRHLCYPWDGSKINEPYELKELRK